MDLDFNLKENLKKLLLIFRMVYDHLGDPYYQGSAATIAYFHFLSILPLVILASQALGLFSLSIDAILKWAEINVSGDGFALLQSLLDHQATSTNNLILLIVAMWAASRANIYLIRLANYTFYDGEIIGRGYVRDRTRSLITVIVTILTLTLSLVAMVYAPLLFRHLIKDSDMMEAVLTVWMTMRWFVMAGLYFLVITLIFYFLPSKRLHYSDILPGSIFTSIALIVVSVFFNIYVSYSTDYDVLYGSFANAVAIIVFFWVIGWVLLIGIIFNRVWWAVRSENKRPIPQYLIDRRNPVGFF